MSLSSLSQLEIWPLKKARIQGKLRTLVALFSFPLTFKLEIFSMSLIEMNFVGLYLICKSSQEVIFFNTIKLRNIWPKLAC